MKGKGKIALWVFVGFVILAPTATASLLKTLIPEITPILQAIFTSIGTFFKSVLG